MVRLLCFVLMLVSPLSAEAQSAVDPDDLILKVELEELSTVPFEQEMILLTIHGIYKRHITLEKLEQPDLAGLNWMQLGEDHWYESVVDGKTVKNMRRRMALFPQEAGTLSIGAFRHNLTLLDENNNWFEHTIQSEPVALKVNPLPATDAWWFPVRGLRVSDNWSNAPDQLAKGEGVLRVVRISALGASFDMIPPMPELTSPSALIFAHPEKRLVDLTPNGPEAIAFWRWTIMPRNAVSAILEPIEFSYFDTVERKVRTVTISAQRVAFSENGNVQPVEKHHAVPAKLRSGTILLSGAVAFVMSLALLVGKERRLSGVTLRIWMERRRLLRQMRQSGDKGDFIGIRKAAAALEKLVPESAGRDAVLRVIDTEIHGRVLAGVNARAIARRLRETF